jgi:hypothetical protein
MFLRVRLNSGEDCSLEGTKLGLFFGEESNSVCSCGGNQSLEKFVLVRGTIPWRCLFLREEQYVGELLFVKGTNPGQFCSCHGNQIREDGCSCMGNKTQERFVLARGAKPRRGGSGFSGQP